MEVQAVAGAETRGIEGRVQGAVGVEPREAAARHPVISGIVAADDDAAVRLHQNPLKIELAGDATEAHPGREAGVESAVGIDAVNDHARDAGRVFRCVIAADDQLAVLRLQREALDLEAAAQVEFRVGKSRIGRAIGVQSDQAAGTADDDLPVGLDQQGSHVRSQFAGLVEGFGIEGGVQGAIGVETGDAGARDAFERAEIAADDHAAIRALDGDSLDGAGNVALTDAVTRRARADVESRVQGAVGIETGDIVDAGGTEGIEVSGDVHLAARGQGNGVNQLEGFQRAEGPVSKVLSRLRRH